MPGAYGFLGGSFDPVQRAHVALGTAALKERRLRAVYFVPAAQSPLKSQGPRASARDRAALLRRALAGRPGLRLGIWELERPGPSFTYQTLRRLRRTYPSRRWEVILGQDAWAEFRRWRRWREIARHHTVVVGSRSGAPGTGPSAVFLRTRLPAHSSTTVREGLARGRAVARFLPPGVGAMIRARRLYR